MNVDILKKEDIPQYNALLLKSERSMFNATLLFGRFIEQLCPGAKPYYFIVRDFGRIIGALPSFAINGPLGPVLNSMPWFGSNPGVIIDPDEGVTFREAIPGILFSAFENTAKWLGCFSSTIISPSYQNANVYYDYFLGEHTDSRIGMVTTLPRQDFEKLMLDKVHSKTRNQIKLALKECQVYEDYYDADWDFLISTHKENMQAIGAPFKEKEFVLIRSLFRQGVDYKLFVVKSSSGERMAALLVKLFNKTVDYMVPAIKAEYRKYCPLHAGIFGAMRMLAWSGYRYWNWGGTKVPGQEGVLHFKERFGGERSEYRYYTKLYKFVPAGLTKEEVLKWYPYFYVMPFSALEENDADKKNGEEQVALGQEG